MTHPADNLLLEIGTEELPASYIQPALDQLRAWGERWAPASRVITWGTPRRLFLSVREVPRFQTDTVWGPPLSRAKEEDGSWNKSAAGFARGHGETMDKLLVGEKKGRPYIMLSLRIDRKKRMGEEVVDLLGSFSFPKSMRWIPGDPFSFARPIRWVVFLWGKSVLDLRVAGVKADRYTRGHRFFGDQRIRLLSAGSAAYRKILRGEYVLVDPKERRKKLVSGILRQQKKYHPRIQEADLDPELLDEVSNLVEYPRVITGSFDESFLNIPAQVLITVMKVHQRYFPVRDAAGRLLPKFLMVVNGPFKATRSIRKNNERVLRARLADAEFFWKEGLRRSLESRVEALSGVVFHSRLGNYYEKVLRVERLAATVARGLGFARDRIELVRRAARLSKSDLITSMVVEFTELQGIMGMEYARRQGEKEAVARAIAEQYLPAAAEGDLPETEIGTVLALADKLDTVAAFLSAGITPSGSRDPYGLRRQAQSVLRLVAEKKLPLRLDLLAISAVAGLKPEQADRKEAARLVLDFFRVRLEALLENRKIPSDLVRAVLSAGWYDVQDVLDRLDALGKLAGTEELMAATTIVERTFNIVRAEKFSGRETVKKELLTEPAEKQLFRALRSSESIRSLIEKKDYLRATGSYARTFSRLLSGFFDEVMVNVKDKRLRRNRMILLHQINRLYSERVADLSLLQFERGEYIV